MEKTSDFYKEHKVGIVQNWYAHCYVYSSEYQSRKKEPGIRREIEESVLVVFSSVLENTIPITEQAKRRLKRFGEERAFFNTGLLSSE